MSEVSRDDTKRLEGVKKALEGAGFGAHVVADAAAARELALSLIPKGAEVFTMASETLEETGIAAALNDGSYDSVRKRLGAMDGKTQAREMRKLGAGPDVAIGSVHAVTETGALLIASLTGSQLPAYAYGAGTVIFVVGSQKVVPDLDAGFRRITETVVPLESERARKAYGLPASFSTFPSKVLVYQREVQAGRVHVILVGQKLGF